jgi:hypothetical protein
MLQSMVTRGETGLSAGKGFYDWAGCDIDTVRKQASAQLTRLMAFLDGEMPKPAAGTEPKARDPRAK